MTPLAPLDPRIARIAASWFHLPDLAQEAQSGRLPQPYGLLVGEQPGRNHNPRLPLWPFPPGSAGARLHRLSGMDLGDYLRRLARINLVEQHADRSWSLTTARARATAILEALTQGPPLSFTPRVVLCGARAATAFADVTGFRELREWFQRVAANHALELVAIPHPSGLSRAYNNPANRELARLSLQLAARTGIPQCETTSTSSTTTPPTAPSAQTGTGT